MTALSRQQLCAALSISESTVRRLELLGLPYTPVGLRAKRYDLAEVKQWLREARCQSGQQAEREECAKVCQEDESGRDSGGYFAELIRARGEVK